MTTDAHDRAAEILSNWLADEFDMPAEPGQCVSAVDQLAGARLLHVEADADRADADRLMVAVLDVALSLNPHRIEQARAGTVNTHAGQVPWRLLAALFDEVERQRPGVIETAFRIAREANR
ncbi:hypothetical protein [Jiangella rhizosphaerae]|uniref:Uncharacterized protein n=1 Tax=Jiangella rhizosphaerae TaxID=2293569 RepID=A0A418KIU5_9ACTN|nr:hypothetical protein [Jiangella rhizosphaerae]RIQ13236.1 hypothetical protein DY240_26155 [Jiangella rhizosphaerae]